MDNTTKGFAQKIISELESIKSAISLSPKENEGPCDRRLTRASPERKAAPLSNNSAAAPKREWIRQLKEFEPVIAVIGTAVLIIYTTVTVALLCSAREANRLAVRTFDAVSRPFIGVDSMNVLYFLAGPDGKLTTNGATRKSADDMQFIVNIKNFGPISGTNFNPSWKMFIDGIVVPPAAHVPDRPSTLFPTQIESFTAELGKTATTAVLKGENILTLEVAIEYDGPSSHYEQCEKYQYNLEPGGILSLGPECGRK